MLNNPHQKTTDHLKLIANPKELHGELFPVFLAYIPGDR